MVYSAEQLCEQFADLILYSYNLDGQNQDSNSKHGNAPAGQFSGIAASDDYTSQSLIFVGEQSQLRIKAQQPAVIVTSSEIAETLKETSLCVIAVADVRLAQAKIGQRYDDYDASDAEWDAVHASAVVHQSVVLGSNVRIGANSVIGRNVMIAENTIVRANCVIEHDVSIGSDCIINNLVNIGYGSRLGNRVIIRPGAIIGNEGFGFAQDDQRHYHRIPHHGIVEIQDDVQIGSNCNIDRGTYGKTTIARGVKIDALCHIAHNVTVDEDTLFVAQTGVAGSSNIGKRVICSGQTGIIDHRTIADDAILLHRCGVTVDIPSAGMWAGTPPKPFKQYVKDLNLSKRVDRLEKKINANGRVED